MGKVNNREIVSNAIGVMLLNNFNLNELRMTQEGFVLSYDGSDYIIQVKQKRKKVEPHEVISIATIPNDAANKVENDDELSE